MFFKMRSKGGNLMRKLFNSFFISGLILLVVPQLMQASQLQFTISGQVTGAAGRVGIDGVEIAFFDGESTQYETTADGGYYSHTVWNGWYGTVTPQFNCYTFSPVSVTLDPVNSNVTQNFEGTYTPAVISGTVTDGSSNPLAGVLLTLSTGGSTLSGADGSYSIEVNCGWEGTITPMKAGWTFTPPSIFLDYVSGNIDNQNFIGTVSSVTYTISGTVSNETGRTGMDGVTITFFDGTSLHTETTAGGGGYSYTVPVGWTGTVTPTMDGYLFTPVFAAVGPLASDVTRDFTGSAVVVTISGTVMDADLNPIPGVTMGLSTGGTDTTNVSGEYSFDVSFGWSGTVTPSAPGWTFEPKHRTYNMLIMDQTGQTYIGTRTNTKYSISGTVTESGIGLEGVVLNGLPGTPVTDASGNYSALVNHGWSGTVVPTLAGYIFTPTNLTYSNVTSSQLNQNYSALAGNPVISGSVTSPGGVGIQGVSLLFSNDGGTAATDENGNYTNTVPSGWSGTVTPTKDGYIFSPTSRTYSSIVVGQSGQDYVSIGGPVIILNPPSLNFGADTVGNSSGNQSFQVSNGGGGTLTWTVTADQGWITYTPAGGSDSGIVTVSVDPSGKTAGTYSGTITVSDPGAVNSPQTVAVVLEVYGDSAPPFGAFNTPLDGSTVSGSIPVTGWALDDVGVENVKIYLEDKSKLVYIGDAVFVEGARPDVELMYPGYPDNSKAGWGYMMLTYFLPNGGNGAYTLHAVAADTEGNETTLGIRTFTCDNASAVKPFGAIDLPAQGGEASGDSYRNAGWALTPMPNMIPEDGSTIDVYVDSVNLGNPVYNIYREDVAMLFPGYANSNGAHAYFDFDTTVYANGVHTIYWIAADDAGNTDGIGSRFFTINNPAGSTSNGAAYASMDELNRLPIGSIVPMVLKKGSRKDLAPQVLPRDNAVDQVIHLRVFERVEIELPDVITGYMIVGSEGRPLPIGSTLDTEFGIFYWLPAAGFYGEYRLLFVLKDQTGELKRKEITIIIDN
jgi:hypothetical protein